MKTRGIRIFDNINDLVSVNLLDILNEIENPKKLNWSIFYLTGTGYLSTGLSITAFEKQIDESPTGFLCTWDELISTVNKYSAIEDIIVVGSKNKTIKWIDDKQKMYEAYEYFIEFFDSSYWQVFTKDESFLNTVKKKFRDIKLLETDFQNEWGEDNNENKI